MKQENMAGHWRPSPEQVTQMITDQLRQQRASLEARFFQQNDIKIAYEIVNYCRRHMIEDIDYPAHQAGKWY